MTEDFNTTNLIDVTHLDTIKLIQAAYDLSQPVGMGYLHFTPNPLTEQEASEFINSNGSVYLDYVKGRCCKFTLRVNDGKKYTSKVWYDHTQDQLDSLLEMAAR